MGQDIPFLGRFWGFIREKCLLFFYIPILGIGCEFFPKLFPKLGTIWEHFPSYSLYRGIIGTCESQYRGIIGTCKSQYRELLRQEKSIKWLLLGHTNPTEGKFLRHGKPFMGGKLCEILVLRLILVASFGIFSQTDFIQIVNCKKFSVMGESPAIIFCRNLGKYIFSFPGSFCIITVAGLLKSFTYFLLT